MRLKIVVVLTIYNPSAAIEKVYRRRKKKKNVSKPCRLSQKLKRELEFNHKLGSLEFDSHLKQYRGHGSQAYACFGSLVQGGEINPTQVKILHVSKKKKKKRMSPFFPLLVLQPLSKVGTSPLICTNPQIHQTLIRMMNDYCNLFF